MSTLIRSACLSHFAQVAAQFHLPTEALLQAAGLSPSCLHEPDLRVPAASVGRLLEMAAVASGDEAFGLRMAEHRRLSNLGPFGLLLREEATLGDVLHSIVKHIRMHNEAMVVQLELSNGLAIVREEIVTEHASWLRQPTELAMGVTHRMLAGLLGPSWRPRWTCFEHRAPRDASVHRRVFGPHVEFGHSFTGLVCDAADLALANPLADPLMAKYVRALMPKPSTLEPDFVQQVRQAIVLSMSSGDCQASDVARHLGCDKRTLARRLNKSGTTFLQLLNACRLDMAQRLLTEGECSLAEIGVRVGFSAPSAFSRWYVHTQGITPRQAQRHVQRVLPR